MTDREDARRAALLKLLENWEAGRTSHPEYKNVRLLRGLVWALPHGDYTLTSAGLAAARAIREGKDE